MFYFVVLVGLVYAVAAFILRNADPRIARWLWIEVGALAVAAAVLIVVLVRYPAFFRAFFGPLGL
jgi:hypothetical protein